MTERVAILVDAENVPIARGYTPSAGSYGPDEVNTGQVEQLALEYGQAVIKNAYGQWSDPGLRDAQETLYEQGYELVHVLGSSTRVKIKNAVDMRLAIDAIGIAHTRPEIGVFIIVCGDGDMASVIKQLQRLGKRVLVVGIEKSTSSFIKLLADRFIAYKTAAAIGVAQGDEGQIGPQPASDKNQDLMRVVSTMKVILTKAGGGAKGAVLKQQLRHHDPDFDQSRHGHQRFSDFIRSLRDHFEVEDNPQGDMTVRLKQAKAPAPPAYTAHDKRSMIEAEADLNSFRFIRDALARRALLSLLHGRFNASGSFSWMEVRSQVLSTLEAEPLVMADGAICEVTSTVLNKHKDLLFMRRLFLLPEKQEGVTLLEAPLRLAQPLPDPQALIRIYECAIVYRLAAAAERLGIEDADESFLNILGLGTAPEDMQYLKELKKEAARGGNPQ